MRLRQVEFGSSAAPAGALYGRAKICYDEPALPAYPKRSHPLPREEVQKLFAARARYNVKSGAEMLPGMPLVAEDLLQTQS